jgi:hypothetical protein
VHFTEETIPALLVRNYQNKYLSSNASDCLKDGEAGEAIYTVILLMEEGGPRRE